MDFLEKYRARTVAVPIDSPLVARRQKLREEVCRWFDESMVMFYTKLSPVTETLPTHLKIVFDTPSDALLFRMRWM